MLTEGNPELEPGHTTIIHTVLHLVQLVRGASLDVQMQNWASIEKIRIVTFYIGQVRAIKDLLRSQRLPNITVATVNSSQGCEADIVIVSFIRWNGMDSPQALPGNTRLDFLMMIEESILYKQKQSISSFVWEIIILCSMQEHKPSLSLLTMQNPEDLSGIRMP
jgi:hypothetical protein